MFFGVWLLMLGASLVITIPRNPNGVEESSRRQLWGNRSLPQRVIAKDERGHRFHNGHGSRKNARIMASAGSELAFLL